MRVGIVGYGKLGAFLCERIEQEAPKNVEIAFVWNRSADKVPQKYKNCGKFLQDLEDFMKFTPDLVVEVAHPYISQKYGSLILQHCDFYAGSPTAFADSSCFEELRKFAVDPAVKGSLYIPVGALWGADDIQRMADRGTLTGLCVTMKKHPRSLKLEPPLSEKISHLVDDVCKADAQGVQDDGGRVVVVYEGCVRDLCRLAPNNVNTMACAAIAGHCLGFDKTQCRLIADLDLPDRHDIEIDVQGPGGFSVKTIRSNLAVIGEVTGQQTYVSFYNSLLKASGRGVGVFFC